jgi:DNA polymerase-1
MKLLLIDGYSLLYRAFFSSPPLTTKDKQPTGALYGFIRMVLNLLDEVQPECALVALDAHGPTFRHDSFEAYKANRSATPDDLQAQTARVRDLLKGLSIPYYEHVGFEADDILGTLSHLGAERGDEVIIVTGDGDSLQLVNDRVSVKLTRRGVSDLDTYTPQAVQERYGFGPELVPDYKGLRGDTSDNIPGIPGIGEKTAIKLITQFGDMDAIYDNLESVTPPRIRELLRTHRDIAFQSRDLARIITNLPLEIAIDACDLPNLQRDKQRRAQALQTVREFEFKSLIARYSDDNGGSAANLEEQEEAPVTVLEPVVTRTADIATVHAWLKDKADGQQGTVLAVQGELIALAKKEDVVLYEGNLEELRDWLADESAGKIVHDSKALKLQLCQQGLKLNGVQSDTLLMSYLIEPSRQQHPLSWLGKKYLSCEVEEFADTQKKKPRTKAKTLFEEESEEDEQAVREERKRVSAILSLQAYVTGLLEPHLRQALEEIGEEDVFQQLELPLVDILVAIERHGMLLDPLHLQKVGKQLEAEAARLQQEIWELAGEEFNIGSPKQLQVILFEKLGMAKGRTTKTGHSTDVHTLEKLAEEHEIVSKILEYRGTTKLKSTYTDALIAGLDQKSNRVHTSLNQTGAVSGRLSSTNPNLQNIPIRTEQGRNIRRAFVAPPGCVLLKADYSQIELRILAHITRDEPLLEAFRTGEDVHARTAADLYHIDVKDVDSEMRRKAKMTNYAIAYGVSGFGLAKQLGGTTPGEGQEIIKRYFEALPGVKKYIDDTIESAKLNGYVQTLIGRRRPLPEINSPRGPERAGAERTAINHPIQGSAADIIKFAMLAVYEEMKKKQMKARMVLQVHDELVFELPPDEVEPLAALLRELMTTVPQKKLKLDVPLVVDISTGPNWNDTQELMEN